MPEIPTLRHVLMSCLHVMLYSLLAAADFLCSPVKYVCKYVYSQLIDR